MKMDSLSSDLYPLTSLQIGTSPFRNTKALLRSLSSVDNENKEVVNRWDKLLCVMKAKKWKKTAIYSMMDLRNALHGFIVFEVLWKDVRGTSASEIKTLQKCLSRLSYKVPSYSPRGNPFNSIDQILDNQEKPKTEEDEEKTEIESTKYEHTLIKFCFTDCNLPFKFKEIITSDIRLLTLVESGLPFWVIFLQSYPLFCKIYRPWMRPLVRILYMIISLITVMIGFYDLYKNVPLLKSTASHLCGPLFNWIEDWEMVSRIRYLGTMLFLQNFEKAVIWSLGTFKGVKMMALMISRRLYEPFEVVMLVVSPVWQFLCEIGSDLGDMVSVLLMPFCSLVADLFKLLVSPFELLFSFIVMIVGLFKPVLSSLWDLCVIPTQTCVQTAKYVALMATEVYQLFEEVILSIARNVIELIQLVKTAKTSSAADVSMWNTLWRDLLSKEKSEDKCENSSTDSSACIKCVGKDTKTIRYSNIKNR
ncbi:hypothetical protein V2J09_005124 [Rumex salicifolius]